MNLNKNTKIKPQSTTIHNNPQPTPTHDNGGDGGGEQPGVH